MTEQIRLLACRVCKSIDQLPDYEGPADRDWLLQRVVEKHRHEDPQAGCLFKVNTGDWGKDHFREQIVKQISDKLSHGIAGEGLGSPFYDLKNTLQEDAMTCWKQHFRNPACNDYKSDTKRITPGTAAERKAAGLPEYRSANDIYLCQYCPVHSLVMEAARWKAGLYK